MLMRRIEIRNYRSISHLVFEPRKYNVFIGPNNHGKSNILRALEFFFSSNKPDEADFFRTETEVAAELSVEVTFAELGSTGEQTFKRYVLPDGTLRARKTGTKEGIMFNGYVFQPRFPWPTDIDLTDRSTVEELDTVYGIAKYFPPKGKITKAILEEFAIAYARDNPESCEVILEDGPLLGLKTVPGSLLGDFYLVPAVRDLRDETKVQTTSWFGKIFTRLLREVVEDHPSFEQLRRQFAAATSVLNRGDDGSIPKDRPSQLTQIEDTLTELLQSWGARLELRVSPPELDKLFQAGMQVLVDDGLTLPADRKGHGLQRALIFAMVQAWVRIQQQEPTAPSSHRGARDRAELTVFAFEEPELYLHPHAQRRLYDSLTRMCELPNLYIFATTHSPGFVDMKRYRELIIVEKGASGTSILHCNRDLFEGSDAAERKRRFNMAYWLNQDRAEAFFARKVVLVEGPTEKAALPLVASRLGIPIHEVTVVDCAGKANLLLYIQVFNAFRRPYAVLHDEDPVRVNPSHRDYERQAREYALNGEIRREVDPDLGVDLVIRPDFEGLLGLPREPSVGKPVAAVEYLSRDEVAIQDELQEIVRVAFSA